MHLSKAALRQTMRTLLRTELGERAEKSAAICCQVAAQPEFRAARRVAIFDAMASEPSLERLWELAPRVFLYPRVQGEKLKWVVVAHPRELLPAARGGGYREPADGVEVELGAGDLLLVPGLAFTRGGARLGRGGGFYDRVLARLPAAVGRLGVCFDLQIVPELPVEEHDLPVTAVITEAGVWRVR